MTLHWAKAQEQWKSTLWIPVESKFAAPNFLPDCINISGPIAWSKEYLNPEIR